MRRDRRTFLKILGISTGYLLWPASARVALSVLGSSAKPVVGINAYYLLVEGYRKVLRNPGKPTRAMLEEYLYQDLELGAIREKTRLNAIRFWAFNDYPEWLSHRVSGSFDGRLWLDNNTLNPKAFEVLEALVEVLGGLELRLIPVLSNYWPGYGGILQYLVWAGLMDRSTFLKALCDKEMEERIYLSYSMKFFTSRRVEECFRSHISRVLDILSKAKNIYIIDVMNEPRGKSYWSIKNVAFDGENRCSDIVARWLNRQAAWIRRELVNRGCGSVLVSSGEEGWTGKRLEGDYSFLKKDSQYYEGVDCVENVNRFSGGLNCASIHLYPHAYVSMNRTNLCGSTYRDCRGWAYLLKQGVAPTPENFRRLADEWILSRAYLLKGKTWYIGEMGWSWPCSSKDPVPMPSERLQGARRDLYNSWHELAVRNGSLGTCIWMLNGREHRDEFYGLTREELVEILKG